jgi:uroporphyrinogen-III synthase
MPAPVLLLTRPEDSAPTLAAALADIPHEAIPAPLSRIEPLDWDRALAEGVRGVILTSANAVPAVAGLAPLPAWCVGGATARAAAAAGFAARASGGDAAALIADLAAARPEGMLLHAHGADLARDLAGALGPLGVAVRSVAVYAARIVPWPEGMLARLRGRRIVAPAFSPRSAAELSARLAGLAGQVQVVAISPAALARLDPALAAGALLAPHPEAMGPTIRLALTRAQATQP